MAEAGLPGGAYREGYMPDAMEAGQISAGRLYYPKDWNIADKAALTLSHPKHASVFGDPCLFYLPRGE
jgi:hypothetical protein